MSDHLDEIYSFELDGESVLLDEKGAIVHVFIGGIEITEHVRWLRIDRQTQRLVFDKPDPPEPQP